MDIKPTNNATGLKVTKTGFLGRKVTVVADFGYERKQTAVLSRKRLLKAVTNLKDGGVKDFHSNLQRIHQTGDKLRLFFKPVNCCDLVVALKSEVIEALN